MKRPRKFVWVVLTLVAILALSAGPVVAKATETDFAGNSILIDIPDWGIWTFPDSNVHVRGFVQEQAQQSTDPRVSGVDTMVINGNWDSEFSGPMWGTNRLEVDHEGGGVWEGTWTGMHGAEGEASFLKGVGHGVAGSVQGLKLEVEVVFLADGRSAIVTGTILDPHGE